MKVGLGTVQFGLEYGISNAAGRTPREEAMAILTMARQAGVRVLDTASAYGGAEALLGELLPQPVPFRVVTKLPPLGREARTREAVGTALAESLRRLRLPSVYGLLVHRADDLLGTGGDEVWAAMEQAHREGRARKIGASVYTTAEIDGLLARYALGLIQAPANVLDQRLVRNGRLRALKEQDVEIHIRSVFLQGLLLMKPDSLPVHFAAAGATLRRFHEAAHSAGLSPLQAAVAYAEALTDVDVTVYGVNDRAQFGEILEATKTRLPPTFFTEFALDDESILNPARWPKLSQLDLRRTASLSDP